MRTLSLRVCAMLVVGCASVACGSATPSPTVAEPPPTSTTDAASAHRVVLRRSLAVGTAWHEHFDSAVVTTASCATPEPDRRAVLAALVTVVTPGVLEASGEQLVVETVEGAGGWAHLSSSTALAAGTVIDVDRARGVLTIAGAPPEDALLSPLRNLIDPGVQEPGSSELAVHLAAFPTPEQVGLDDPWPPDAALFAPIAARTRSGHPWDGPLDATASLLEVSDAEGGPAQRIVIRSVVPFADIPAPEGRTVTTATVTFDINVLVPVDPRYPILEERFQVDALYAWTEATGQACENRMLVTHARLRSDVRVATAEAGD